MSPRRRDTARPSILTIDGPAGVGKSSVARRVADRLGFFHLDTGATYRAVTLAAQRAGVTEKTVDEAHLAPVVQASVNGRLKVGPGGKVWLDGEEVTETVRSAPVTALVSPVSALPVVRRALVELQRRIGVEEAARSRGVVVEGRDAGSHIFPNARWRFYLDASLRERARRRLKQERRSKHSGGDPHELTAAMESLAQRDRIDRERPVAPLCIPDGATVLDTTHLGLEEVVEAIARTVERKSSSRSAPRKSRRAADRERARDRGP
jgi:cytidylate kinase